MNNVCEKEWENKSSKVTNKGRTLKRKWRYQIYECGKGFQGLDTRKLSDLVVSIYNSAQLLTLILFE